MLVIAQGGTIFGRTQGNGNAGSILLKVNALEANNGGQVVTTSFTAGDAGDIKIFARDRIQLEGRDATYQDRVAITLFNALGGEYSGIYANTNALSTGASGNITLQTNRLALSDTAQISASSQGMGVAGGLDITAEKVQLNNATIQAESRSGDRGNIQIATPILLLRDHSQITTNATGSATGGNISLNAPIIIGTGNSDIVARATQGAGGNINIQSSGLFGIAPRPQLTPSSDINASSELGFDGTVAISTPSIDPNSGLVELPSNLADSTNELSAGCSASQNNFTASGRGGLPENPLRTLANNRPWQDFRPIQTSTQALVPIPTEVKRSPVQAQTVSTDQIAEATTWHRNSANEVILASAIAAPNSTTACLSRQTAPTALAE